MAMSLLVSAKEDYAFKETLVVGNAGVHRMSSTVVEMLPLSCSSRKTDSLATGFFSAEGEGPGSKPNRESFRAAHIPKTASEKPLERFLIEAFEREPEGVYQRA